MRRSPIILISIFLLAYLISPLFVSEIGHNWGSMHDNDGSCNNNFLMNEFAQVGDNPNNYVSSLSDTYLILYYTFAVFACSCSLLAVGL